MNTDSKPGGNKNQTAVAATGQDSANTDQAVVSSMKSPGRRYRIPKPHGPWLWGSIAVAAVLLIGVVLWLNRPAIEVSAYGKKLTVSQAEYKALTAQADGASGALPKQAVYNAVVKAYKYKLVTTHLDLAPTNDDISAAALAGGVRDTKKLTDWDRLSGYVAATDNEIIFAANGGWDGTVLFYPYDRLFVDAHQAVPKPAHFGEASSITADRDYAYTSAKTDHDNLVKGSAKVDKLIERLHSDPRLQFATASNDSYRFKADTQGLQYKAGSDDTFSISDYVISAAKALGKPGISPVGQMRSSFPPFVMAPGYPTTTDVAYYIVVINKVFQPNPHLQQQFQSDLAQVKVVSHVK